MRIEGQFSKFQASRPVSKQNSPGIPAQPIPEQLRQVLAEVKLNTATFTTDSGKMFYLVDEKGNSAKKSEAKWAFVKHMTGKEMDSYAGIRAISEKCIPEMYKGEKGTVLMRWIPGVTLPAEQTANASESFFKQRVGIILGMPMIPNSPSSKENRPLANITEKLTTLQASLKEMQKVNLPLHDFQIHIDAATGAAVIIDPEIRSGRNVLTTNRAFINLVSAVNQMVANLNQSQPPPTS